MDGYSLKAQSHESAYQISSSAPPIQSNVSAVPGFGPEPGSHSSHGSSSNNAPSSMAPRIRRRNRMITSCLECRRRKLKCNKSHPCTNCQKFGRNCIFLAPNLDQARQLKLTEIKEKVGSLERLLERDVAKPAAESSSVTASTSSPSQGRALPDDKDDELPAADDEKDLEPSPLGVVDAAYDDHAEDDHNDDLLDLGIQMGRMRITERIGGFVRPKIASELEYMLNNTSALSSQHHETLPPAQDYLKPGPSYIAPASSFFFGESKNQSRDHLSPVDFLPSRLVADRLVEQYFEAVHPLAQIVHRLTFENQYEAFWGEVSLGMEPSKSVQTIVFATMFSGVVSMDESVIERDFGVSKSSLIDNFRLGTETALGRANFLRTTKIETLQAFVMYLIPLCRAEVSRAHSVLLGAAVRMAECMGLHRDGETYGLNPLEIHVRRLIWHQICFLDIRTCEAQGPRPTIRKDDFDTELPLNIDDIDLHTTGKPPVGAERWTDSTFSLIRFEANEMMRTIWVDRPRLEQRKVSLTAVLSKIETFRTNMEAKYDHFMDDRVPIQKCAKIVKALLIARMYVMVLHRYHHGVLAPMPDRLRQIMIASGTQLLETAVALETLPELQRWSWYSGAFNQYHSAALLLMEMYLYPHRKEADRIWTCLDYVFETQPEEPRPVKARKVLAELQRKTTVYQNMRGMRAPVAMQKVLNQRAPPSSESRGSFSTESATNTLSAEPEPLSVGKAPIQDMVFAGVSNGETLWALPNQPSPEPSSEAGSRPPPGPSTTDSNSLMDDVDWEAFDALFPPEQQALDLDQPTFLFPSHGLFQGRNYGPRLD